MANITLQTIESLPLVEEVNENTSLVGWDGTQTVRVPNSMVGGSELPEVTTEDNGKVLGVVDGTIGLMDASSGGDTRSGETMYMLTETFDRMTGDSEGYTIDVSFDELHTLYESGKMPNIVYHCDMGANTVSNHMSRVIGIVSSNDELVLCFYNFATEEPIMERVSYRSDGTLTKY